MLIKNTDELATTALRRQVLDLIEVGISRVLPSTVLQCAVNYDAHRGILTLGDYVYSLEKGRIFVIGGGKAAGLMAQTLEGLIPSAAITDGVVCCKTADYATAKINVKPAGHPLPDQNGVACVNEMLALKAQYSIGKDDLVICLISGGGSALMPAPADGITLQDKQTVTKLLLSSGANIHQINAVRKHLSKTKGGRLGRCYAPATVVSLILSDVVGNDLDVIASGPTYPDQTTFMDAYRILDQYHLLDKAPQRVVALLKRGIAAEIEDTPKQLDNCYNYIIGDNKLALEAMSARATELGFHPYVITTEQQGDTTAQAKLRAQEIIEHKYAGHDLLLIGGETTPTLSVNAGRGGRNQHYAAVSMQAMREYSGAWAMASVGTDGSDFLPDVAGAIVDNHSLASAQQKGLDVASYLDRYDSNTFLARLGNSLIITGNTGTNVGDVIVYALP